MSDLAVGGLVAHLSYYSSRFRAFFTNAKKSLIIILYAAGLIMLAFLNEFIFSSIHASYMRLIAAMFFAFVIMEQIHSHSSPFKAGTIGAFSKLGIISYGLYLIHPMAIQVTYLSTRLLKTYYEEGSLTILTIRLIASFILTVALSLISYKYIEAFFLSYKHRLKF